MDRPLAFDAEGCGAPGGGRVAIGIGEVAERTVDGAQAVGPAGNRHARQGRMPLVAGIVGVEAADVDGAGLAAGGIVGDPEMHRLQPSREGGDRLDIGHAERRLDQRFETDAGLETLGHLDLVDHGLDHVEVGRHADLRHQDRVEPVAGLLHHVDDVAIHVVRVETVDAHRDGLALGAPVDVVQRLDDILARALLVRRRDRILDVEEDEVGGAIGRLVDHLGVRSRNGEFAALEAQLAKMVDRVAHDVSSRLTDQAALASWLRRGESGNARSPRRRPSPARASRRSRATPFRRPTARRRPSPRSASRDGRCGRPCRRPC